MKKETILKGKDVISNQRVRELSRQKSTMIDKTEISPVYTKFAEEGQEDFYNYLDWLGLAKGSDTLILTSSHHYYFEIEDLKNITTVINLKKLNSIKKAKDFLHAIYVILPQKCYFIGCFTDNKKQGSFLSSKKSLDQIKEQVTGSEVDKGLWDSFLGMLYDIIDSKTNKYLSEKIVRLLLEETGLKILDMTEFNGLTYFCAQKDNPSVE